MNKDEQFVEWCLSVLFRYDIVQLDKKVDNAQTKWWWTKQPTGIIGKQTNGQTNIWIRKQTLDKKNREHDNNK